MEVLRLGRDASDRHPDAQSRNRLSTSVERMVPSSSCDVHHPGGRVNVARVVKRFGGDVEAILPARGVTGKLLHRPIMGRGSNRSAEAGLGGHDTGVLLRFDVVKRQQQGRDAVRRRAPVGEPLVVVDEPVESALDNDKGGCGLRELA